jgi:hypothetical protein
MPYLLVIGMPYPLLMHSTLASDGGPLNGDGNVM